MKRLILKMSNLRNEIWSSIHFFLIAHTKNNIKAAIPANSAIMAIG